MKPTPLIIRTFCIAQLCLGFILICIHFGRPYLTDLYVLKTDQALFESVMQNRYFQELPQEQRASVETHYATLITNSHQSAGKKFRKALNSVLLTPPPFERAWIVGSIAIPLLILLQIEGALSTAWLLPLIVIAYGINNQKHGTLEQQEANLFPTEELLITYYLGHPFSGGVEQQRKELLIAWERYLVSEWSGESPSKTAAVFEEQKEKGSFNFNLARLEKTFIKEFSSENAREKKRHPYLLAAFFLWNMSFAIVCYRYR